MELKDYSFKELLSALGEKLDSTTSVTITPLDCEFKEPEEDPYEGVFIPPFVVSNSYVSGEHLVGYITEDNEKLPLYVVVFDDSKARSYTHDKNSIFKNRGKNIYDNPDTVIVDTSIDWKAFVIDDITGNGGKEPSSVYAIL